MAYYNTQSQPTFQPAYNNFHTPTQALGNYTVGVPTPATSTPNNSITWVQGEQAARSYPVISPNTSVLLMDSEGDTFYIKSTDASGMPQPLRIFDYVERSLEPVQSETKTAIISEPEYVTKKEFDKKMDEIASRIRKGETKREGKKQ